MAQHTAQTQAPKRFAGESRLHVALNVRDIEKSRTFYSAVFDQPATKIRPGYAKFEVAQPPVNFTLNQSQDTGPARGTLSHLGIQLHTTEQLAQVRKRLPAELVRADESETSCCFALQNKFWLRDPDGNDLEFFVVLGDTEKNAPEHAACCGG